ncbi:MAG: hypothetical protein B9S32_01495 [Verrucomicrobia bacterium Tous-C9LFEB]|nr:MAG: hypothetical protein B9S32_01495 [Verrucomicrobia bacterium Tous-C9LFEB]
MTFKQRLIIRLLRYRLVAILAEKLHVILCKCWEQTEGDIALRLSPDLRVLAGPFAGLKFPSIEQVSLSKVLPKILGSYEEELHPVIRSLKSNTYSTIINIGCAEGYYAVGLAMRFPQARVYAFDLNATSREQAAYMAKMNGVQDRISFHGLFSPETIEKFQWEGPLLIVCDCEGGEYSLITPEIWKNCTFDALIEIHDCRAATGKAAELAARFAPTHHPQWICGTDRHEAKYPNLSSFSSGERYRILNESRPGLMDWLWLHRLTPKA